VTRHLRPVAVLLAAAALTGAPSAARAQPAVSRAPAGCTYDTCALRVEPKFFLAPRLLRGRAGADVGQLGAFGGGVDTLLAGPEEAASQARRYVHDVRVANTLGLLGAAAFVVALSQSDNLADADPATATIALAGAGLGIASIPFAVNAGRHLSRAVWFYNAALAH